MAAKFIFDPSKGETPETLAGRRRVAEALMGQTLSRTPKNLGEGLTTIANALVARSMMTEAETGQQAITDRANAAYTEAISGFGGDPAASVSTSADTGSAGGVPSFSAAKPAGDANASFAAYAPQVISQLSKDFDISSDRAAGVVGQLGHESEGLQAINERVPVVPGSRGGFGWAQWTGPRRKAFEAFAAANGMDVTSPEANYSFLKSELSSPQYAGALQAVRDAPDAMSAGRAFTDKFLIPGVPNYASRDNWTRRALAYAGPAATAPMPTEFATPAVDRMTPEQKTAFAAGGATTDGVDRTRPGDFPNPQAMVQPIAGQPASVGGIPIREPLPGTPGGQPAGPAGAQTAALTPPAQPLKEIEVEGQPPRSASRDRVARALLERSTAGPLPDAPNGAAVMAGFGNGAPVPTAPSLGLFSAGSPSKGGGIPQPSSRKAIAAALVKIRGDGTATDSTSAASSVSPAVKGVAQALVKVQQSPGNMANIERLARAAAEPGLNQGQRAVVNALLERELKGQESRWSRLSDTVLYDQRTGETRNIPTDPNARPSDLGLNPQYGVDAQGNPVILQLGKDGRGVQTQLPPGVKLSKEPIKLDAGTHFVLLDPITRQAVGTIPKDIAGEARQSATGKVEGTTTAEARAGLGDALSQSDYSIRLIDDMLKHPGRATGTGLSATIDPRNYVPGTDAYDFAVRRRQMQGRAFLQAFDSLRGGGQITEIEGQKATDAIARLESAQSDEAYVEALNELRGILVAGQSRARAKAGGWGGASAGQPATPAPTAPGGYTRQQLEDEARRRGLAR